MADHNELGKEGERIAVDYLRKKGFTILKQNYRFKRAEVDIITMYKDVLRIIEVKTRQSHYMAGPEITVTKKKQKAIIRVANAYVDECDYDGETQFDIISIVLNENNLSLEHLEDAYCPGL